MIESRNATIRASKNAVTETGEKIVLIESRHESFRRAYGPGGGVSGIMNRWIGRDANGELFMGRSLSKMRRVTNDSLAARAVISGLGAKE